MGWSGHFESLPVGVKILAVLSALGLISNLLNLPLFLGISFSHPNLVLFSYACALGGFIFGAVQLYGLWFGKKWVQYLYVLAVLISLGMVFFVPVFFPTYYSELMQGVLDSWIGFGMPPEIEPFVVSLSVIFISAAMVVNVVFYAVLVWYVRHRRDFFLN